MSELTAISKQASDRRLKLLISASAFALAAASSQRAAMASNIILASDDTPSFWLELGGGFDRIDDQMAQWMPPAHGQLAGSGAFIRKGPSGSFGIDGKIIYQPHQSDWNISISARYGRSQRQQAAHEQTAARYTGQRTVGYTSTTRHLENHMIVDFKVGKDVGLGLFGSKSNSEVALGVRIAQFNFAGDDLVSSAPYRVFPNHKLYFHTGHIERRTSAEGPSLSWEGTVPLAGGNDSRLSLDWGALGALLFGKQKISDRFKGHEFYRYGSTGVEIDFPPSNIARRKSVLIPNLEGSLALSFNLPAAKITAGYRANFFFNAMDGGIDMRKSEKIGFYGPFAAISIGIGG